MSGFDSLPIEPALVQWWNDLLARIPDMTGMDHDPQGAGRWQDDRIVELIPRGSTVLDLGCGDGLLLERLRLERGAIVQGVELDAEAVFACAERGVPVIQHDLNRGLDGFADQAYDVVICEETLQAVERPVQLLDAILRIGRRGIVAFPNFAHWRMRLDLFLRGRMPTTSSYPYRWHDSPNIHPTTLADIEDWCREQRVHVALAYAWTGQEVRPLAPDDNLHAEQVLMLIER
jgi:methionine biosynthesis protein MetW